MTRTALAAGGGFGSKAGGGGSKAKKKASRGGAKSAAAALPPKPVKAKPKAKHAPAAAGGALPEVGSSDAVSHNDARA
jgi:hypothetical protein